MVYAFLDYGQAKPMNKAVRATGSPLRAPPHAWGGDSGPGGASMRVAKKGSKKEGVIRGDQ